ncbi:HEAT repeat domain-containing protein [Microcoleus sp. LEGE 07076]|uniref:HEAT repeat domain-containing protein n=1 Tax=Microcoleus sp. LEGE 07076 TaxID=915322 RepID=UPI001881C3F4|nr:HEAT repeat domain-containing protein [Microcoleus sp. LEGE 07076]MBE9187794.1 HEAT repeat domain-containing protein [Microcoleus sp. LEGE 07076]
MPQEELFQQLKHPNPHLRKRAMSSIAETRDETTIPRLMGILDEEDVVYRRSAVQVLGIIGNDAVPLLVDSLLNSKNVTIQASCAKALTAIAVNYPDITFPELGLQGLQKALTDPNPVVYISSLMALGQIGTPALDILIETIDNTDNIALAVAITGLLATIGGTKAEEVLSAAAANPDANPYIRESAVSALSRMNQVTKWNSGG